ncbi:MAG: alpha/beta hydrolase [Barnesiella sp.]|nr:alpha/beta hydrolase [Barnesiella sp.]
MEKTLQHNGVKMLYTVEGEGSPVVLMHGWGCTHETVKSIEDICLKSHKVYNVDFPGFGASTEPADDGNVWGVEEYTRMIERLAEAEGIENPILIGHSFGGRVAIVYASRNKVDKIVLVDAAGVKPRRKLSYYIKVYSFKLAKRWFKLVYGKEKGERHIEKMRNKRGSSDYANSSAMMKAILSKVVNEDLCHLMPKISAPTLLIWGKNDTATPLSDAKKMEKLIPDAGLVAFDDCGHYSFLDNRPGFAAVLNSFIN